MTGRALDLESKAWVPILTPHLEPGLFTHSTDLPWTFASCDWCEGQNKVCSSASETAASHAGHCHGEVTLLGTGNAFQAKRGLLWGVVCGIVKASGMCPLSFPQVSAVEADCMKREAALGIRLGSSLRTLRCWREGLAPHRKGCSLPTEDQSPSFLDRTLGMLRWAFTLSISKGFR